MSVTYYGIELEDVPTGFGIYTGINIRNAGDTPVRYDISIEKVDVGGIPPEDEVDTLFLLKDLNVFTSLESELQIEANPNSNSKFYVVHKPFRTDTDDYETARITINTLAYNGDEDDEITIDVTGVRVTGAPNEPPVPNSFYTVLNWNATDGVHAKFNWSYIKTNSYVTGFKLDLASDSSFSSLVDEIFLPVESNSSDILPDFGKYAALSGFDFSLTAKNLGFGSSYYARLKALNNAVSPLSAESSYVYGPVFRGSNPNLTQEQIESATSAPPEIVLTPGKLQIIYKVTENNNPVDVLLLLKNENGGNGYNFMGYNEAEIIFEPLLNNVSASIVGNSTYPSPLYTLAPNEYSFNVDSNNIFKLTLKFNRVSLYGYGGEGVTPNSLVGGNGGALFNFDNLNYTDNGVLKQFNYYIVKDIYSEFVAGVGGGQGFVITDTDTEDRNSAIYVNGGQIDYVNYINLVEQDVQNESLNLLNELT
jgi:hypothetical protein